MPPKRSSVSPKGIASAADKRRNGERAIAYKVNWSYNVANYSNKSRGTSSGSSGSTASSASLSSWNTNSNASGSVRADRSPAYPNDPNISSYKSSRPPSYTVDSPSSRKNTRKREESRSQNSAGMPIKIDPRS